MPPSIRSQFPALARCHLGRPVAYFDGPGGTQVPTAVGEAMEQYLYHHNANTHWQYPTSIETDEIILEARRTYADLFQARSWEEIAFGLNMTTLTMHVARSLGRGWGPADEIVVTELDHHGNVAPWRALVRERGVVVKTARFDLTTGELDLDDLARCLGPRTRLVAVGAASNALGTINPVARIVEMAHAVGALAYVDAVHYSAHEAIDVQAWNCDFLVCSAYKLYGPHIGVLYGRRELLAGLDVPKLEGAPDAPPERLENGTQNHEGIAGAAAAVEFVARLAPAAVHGSSRRARLEGAYEVLRREGELLVLRLWDGLASLPSVRLYGPPPGRPRTPTVSFTVRDLHADDVARRLASRAVFVSSGDFYATTVAERLGVAKRGFVRAGSACYTTIDEIDRLIDAIAGIGG
jgi:cysteine desulfurase family protein (TIGR01976 family)